MMWTNEEWHFTHCLFMLKLRFSNGLLRNRGLSWSALDPVHLAHCLNRVSASDTPRGRKKVNTGVAYTDFDGRSETPWVGGECYMPILWFCLIWGILQAVFTTWKSHLWSTGVWTFKYFNSYVFLSNLAVLSSISYKKSLFLHNSFDLQRLIISISCKCLQLKQNAIVLSRVASALLSSVF